MTQDGGPGSQRDPPSARPRLGRWGERALFFSLGASMPFFAGRWVGNLLPGPDGIEELAFEAAVGVAFLVLRVVRGPSWRWLSYTVGVASAWMMFLVLLLGPSTIANYVNQRNFDADAWRSAVPGRSETRVWMVDDLLAHHSPVGRPVAEIDELLGPDDSERGSGWGRGCFPTWDRAWWLGDGRGFFPIDSEWLVLRVGPGGDVTEFRVVRD